MMGRRIYRYAAPSPREEGEPFDAVAVAALPRRPEAHRRRLRLELKQLFRSAFPEMPEAELRDWVEDYFRSPPGDSQRYALLLADEFDHLVATTLFDWSRLEYGGRFLHGVYILDRAVSPAWRNFGLGREMAATILTRFHPDILMTTCTQSPSLHSWIRAVRRTPATGLEVFPRYENKIAKPFPCEDFELAVSVFKRLYRGVVNGKEADVERAVAALTRFLVRKGLYTERYDSHPWKQAGKEDLLAQALGADPGDGILLVVLKKGLRSLLRTSAASSQRRSKALHHPSEAPAHHSEAPAHHSEAPAHHSEAPDHHSEAPAHHSEAPDHHSEAPDHHSEAPDHHSEAPDHHSEAPDRLPESPGGHPAFSNRHSTPLHHHSRGGGNPVLPTDGQPEPAESPDLLPCFLDRVRAKLPAMDRALTQYGHLSLREYVEHLPVSTALPLQHREPLLDMLHDYVSSLLGTSIAGRAVADFAARPLVLTTNHHGVDYYAQTLQSRLIFALGAAGGSPPAGTVLVFACGNVPLNNPTYPRGMLFYRGPPEAMDALPWRLPLFPDRLKRTMVSLAPACTAGMVDNALHRLDARVRLGGMPSEVARAARTQLLRDYRSDALANLSSYSAQAVVLNRMIWRRLFAEGFAPPEMVYLELEQIASALLGLDLNDPASLARQLFFDKVLLENVLTGLNGVRGCWDRSLLGARGGGAGCDGPSPREGVSCGTVLFWGVDANGRRIPLDLRDMPSGTTRLHGRDDRGKTMEIPWTPRGLAEALNGRKLVPSLFTSFLVIAFARGVSCIGGYFQSEYLAEMQRGLAAALRAAGGHDDVARAVLQVPASLYLDGMAVVMSRTEGEYLIPAGPLEIMAGGGLSGEDLERIASLTLEEAHLADLFETIPDAIPPELRPAGWRQRIAATCHQVFEEKIVIK